MNSNQVKKKVCAVWIIVLLIISAGAQAQSKVPPFETVNIEPLHLAITYHKTTNLVFPYAVKSVDRGSRDVLVQKAKGVENILQVKAGLEDFEETNLTVITADGQLYSFLLDYSREPITINLEVGKYRQLNKPVARFSDAGDNEAIVGDVAEQVAVKKTSIRKIKDRRYEMGLRLTGLYIQEDVLYFQLEMENNSNIHYDIEQFRMYIRDKRKAKRTASQELEQLPLQVTGNTKVIRGQSLQTVVFAVPKFTIPDKKYLSIELMERNGGRHLGLKVNNKAIVKALPVK